MRNAVKQVFDEYTESILEELEQSKDFKAINPAQDFFQDKLFYAVQNNSDYYLLSSDRRIIKFDDLEENGYIIRNGIIPSTCNFRIKSAAEFIKGKSVNILDCFNSINSQLQKYIYFDDSRIYNILTIWTIGTYFYRAFRYYPYIWLNADKGSGKTRVMEVLRPLAFNAIMAVNSTEASIFRFVDTDCATLFIDEFEKLKKDNQQGIITLLNSGFNFEGSVVRTEKAMDTYKPKTYSAFSPKMFAGIADISDVLMDRCIKVKLLKKPKDTVVQSYKLDDITMEQNKTLRDELYICALEHAGNIKKIYDSNKISMPDVLSDREQDIWEVLFSIAKYIDETNKTNIIDSLNGFAIDSSKERAKINIEKNDSYKLISILVDVLPTLTPKKIQDKTKYYDSDELFGKFKKTEEFGWLKSKNYLTTMLSNKFHINNDRVTISGKKTRLYAIPDNHIRMLVERYNLNEVVDVSNF